MYKKIMNPISYILCFFFEVLMIFPVMLIVGFILVAFCNVLVFQVDFGYWYLWSVLVISVVSSFFMAVETFEK